jgi:hypothetical protein
MWLCPGVGPGGNRSRGVVCHGVEVCGCGMGGKGYMVVVGMNCWPLLRSCQEVSAAVCSAYQ